MLTDSDILTITEIVSGCIETVMVSINEMKADIHTLKVDVAGLKKDVAGLKKDVAGLKEDVHSLKEHAVSTSECLSLMRADLAHAHRRLDTYDLAKVKAKPDKAYSE